MPVQADVDALRTAGILVRLVRFLDERLRTPEGGELDLTELSVLGAIDRGHVLPSAIARFVRLDPGRVSRVVDQLVTRGYVERGHDPDDRRRCPLSITEAGDGRLRTGRALVDDFMRSAMAELDETQRECFSNALERIRTLFE